MKLNVSLIWLLSLAAVAMAEEDITSPLKLRFNGDFLRSVMLRQDQEILYLFKNVNLGSYPLGEDLILKNMKVSLEPSKGKFEEYD